MSERIARYRILYRDIDSMGVLYYGRYLDLFELGRVEWMREDGILHQELEAEHAVMLPVVRSECRYHAPLRYDDVAEIRTSVQSWTWTTVSFRYAIYREEGGVLCATGGVELGCVRTADFRPARLPAHCVEILRERAPEAWGRTGARKGVRGGKPPVSRP